MTSPETDGHSRCAPETTEELALDTNIEKQL